MSSTNVESICSYPVEIRVICELWVTPKYLIRKANNYDFKARIFAFFVSLTKSFLQKNIFTNPLDPRSKVKYVFTYAKVTTE